MDNSEIPEKAVKRGPGRPRGTGKPLTKTRKKPTKKGTTKAKKPATPPPPVKPPSPAKLHQAQIDWVFAEREYRQGLMPLRTIASLVGCTEASLRERAKKHGWPRDLSVRVKARAEEKLNKEAMVQSRKALAKTAPDEVEAERLYVEGAAELISQVIQGHRSDLGRARKLVNKLFIELELTGDNIDALQRVGELLKALEVGEAQNALDAYRRILALPARIKGVKDLTGALIGLVEAERVAYGIDTEESQESAAEKLLRELGEEALRGR